MKYTVVSYAAAFDKGYSDGLLGRCSSEYLHHFDDDVFRGYRDGMKQGVSEVRKKKKNQKKELDK